MINYWLEQATKDVLTVELKKMILDFFKSGSTEQEIQQQIKDYLKSSGHGKRYKVWCHVDISTGEITVTVV